MTRESAEGSQRDGVGTPGTHLPGGAIPKGCPHEELLGAPRFTLLPSPAPRPYRRSSPVASRPQGKHRNHSAGPSASLTAQPRGVYLLPSNPGWAGTRGGAEGEHVTAHPAASCGGLQSQEENEPSEANSHGSKRLGDLCQGACPNLQKCVG